MTFISNNNNNNNISWCLSAFICSLVLTSGLVSTSEHAPIVKTHSGPVRGLVVEFEKHKIDFYQGIRYGEVPHRFGLPKPVSPWTEVYNATHFRSACPQTGKHHHKTQHLDIPSVKQETDSISEDCLFLNIWRPSSSSSSHQFQSSLNQSSLPVMFFIHGGGFHSGTIFNTVYDGRVLVSLGQVVVVSVNYRLGAFGFFYGGNKEAPGNQGLHDQLLALKWVHSNIALFGGDPNRVTLFGQSAGSMAVGSLVLSPLATGLFHRAIMQSGSPNVPSVGSSSPKTSLVKAQLLAQKHKCSHTNQTQMIACMRSLPMESLLAGFNVLDPHVMAPMYGDTVMPLNPIHALKTGKFNQVDLVYGVTANEGSIFVAGFLPEIHPSRGNATLEKAKVWMKSEVEKIGFGLGEDVVEFYFRKLNHSSTQQKIRDVVMDLFSDFHLVCPTILFGESIGQKSTHRVYAYRLEQQSAMYSAVGLNCPAWKGVCHAADLPFTFGLPEKHPTSANYRKVDDELSRAWIAAWTKFAHDGQLGSMGQVHWDQALKVGQSTAFMALKEGHFRMVHNFFQDTCDRFWKAKIFVE